MFSFNPDSRKELKFDVDKVQDFQEDFHDVITSKFHFRLMNLRPVGVYVITTEEFRPDLISYNIYGDVQYKMLLMEYNNILNVEDLVAGVRLQFPSLAEMESIYIALRG